MPARHPLSSGGVRTTPSSTTNTLLPVASHSSPRVLANMASRAPCPLAKARATTLSAYDVVLSPAVAARSLRTHGTVTTVPCSSGRACGTAVTMWVRAESCRSEPSGPRPAVTVNRSRPNSIGAPSSTASMPSRMWSWSAAGRPRPAMVRSSRRRWRVTANGTPPSIFAVSNAPSPTVTPWSTALTAGVSAPTSVPSTQTRMSVMRPPSHARGRLPWPAPRDAPP